MNTTIIEALPDRKRIVKKVTATCTIFYHQFEHVNCHIKTYFYRNGEVIQAYYSNGALIPYHVVTIV